MQLQKFDSSEERTDEARRSIHDIAAAIISVRALAETLSEHIPTLVAISHSRSLARNLPIPAETLDALPSIPAEIVELCEIARVALQTLGKETKALGKSAPALTSERPYAAGQPVEPSSEQVDREGPRILLVEDEVTVRYVIAQSLLAQGCRVTSSADGEEALRLLAAQTFDLVLMDLRIPGMSGWETTQKIRQRETTNGRYTRIVGLTASPLLEDQQRARDAGMDDVLVKPINETALQSVLSRFT